MSDIKWHGNLWRWLRGNDVAEFMIRDLWCIIELWDDLIDKDKSVSDSDINAAFYSALVALPRNAFYQANFSALNALIESAILDWHAANAFEKINTEAALRQAYVLRCSMTKVIIASARIIGGIEWARTVGQEIHLLGDTWEDYSQKHKVQ